MEDSSPDGAGESDILIDNHDVIDSVGKKASDSRNKFQISAPIKDDYQVLPFKDSLRFLALFDPAIREQQFTLHKWQVEVNEDISYGRSRSEDLQTIIKEYKPDSIHPYKFALCAANGSGKDAFVIAPLALWFICTKIKAKVIITSASGAQLSTQTEHYIAALAREVNLWAVQHIGQEILKVRKRHVYCLLSGSVIHMFATDEGEKAEGHHPTCPGAEMMIIVNEAKSVSPQIFDALRRCTGFNFWINVSSPGEPSGPFYTSFRKWPNKRRISYFDCPHQSPDEFEEDRRDMGEHSPLFRSKWLALFTYIGGRYVVSKEKLDKLLDYNRKNLVNEILQHAPIRIGIDIALSTNGDETVISVWRGNKMLAQYTYRIQDSTILVELLNRDLLKHVDKDHRYIFADDGGVGRSVIDMLNRKGFRINRVLNNTTKKVQKGFKNRGAQSWYKFARLIEEGVLIFLNPDDDRLMSQIVSRKYKETDGGIDKMTLEPKRDMIAEGHPSPDRADAAVLAFTDISIKEFLENKEESERIAAPQPTNEEVFFEIKSALRHGRKHIVGEEDYNPRKKKAYGSLQILLKQGRGLRLS